MVATVEDVRAALGTVKDPEIRRPITELGMVDALAVGDDGVVSLTVLLTIAACPMRDRLTTDVTTAVRAVLEDRLYVNTHREILGWMRDRVDRIEADADGLGTLH